MCVDSCKWLQNSVNGNLKWLSLLIFKRRIWYLSKNADLHTLTPWPYHKQMAIYTDKQTPIRDNFYGIISTWGALGPAETFLHVVN